MSLLHAHLVTLCQRRVFTNNMLTICEATLRGTCTELDVDPIAFNGEADHLHLLIAYPSTLPVTAVAQRPKGGTAHAVRREYTGACLRS